MTGPLVTALGHAGLSIESPGLRIHADPWVSGRGAFLGSWFPFPDNGHLPGPVLHEVDAVVVSHDHLDHLDLPYLSHLPADVPVIVPRYPSRVLERRLAAAGRENVVVLEPWERHWFGPDSWLTVIQEQCPMSHDAAVLVRTGGRSVLHVNDARISLAQARRAAEEGGGIDLMAVQMSGASWHPVCYEYDEAERNHVCDVKRISKFRAVTRLVRALRPGMAIPYAGPPCFLDPDLFELNARLHPPDIFPDQAEALGWLRDHLPHQASDLLLPGDALDLAGPAVVRDPFWRGFSLEAPVEERRRYLDDYAERRRPAVARAWQENPPPDDDASLGVAFAEHLSGLGELSHYFTSRIQMTVRFEVTGPGGGTWDASADENGIQVDLDGGESPAGYRLRLDGRWLRSVVEGRARWEELLLSLRFSARRMPDQYNDYLVGLLKHADLAALRAVERYEAARDPFEMVELNHEGGTVRVSRYCPHAGEDLAQSAVLSGGVLRCLGHNLEFDLATGECVNARCDPLRVEHAVTAPG